MKDRQSAHDVRQRQAERQLSIPALLLLAVATAASFGHQAGDPITVWAVVWAVGFLLAFVLFIASLVRGYIAADELQKLVHLRAIAPSFIVTVGGLFTASLLYSFGIGEPIAMLHALFILSVATWLAATRWYTRRAARD